MKLPITEKFLLDVYSCAEKLDKSLTIFSYWKMKDYCHPYFYELRNEYKKKQTKQQFSQMIYHLKKNGYIRIKNLEQKKGIVLTRKGAEKVLKVKFKTSRKRKRSDRKWQMIIFDIPEEKRHLRNLLRKNLYFLKYEMLQQSIWVCPYDVLSETEFILRKHSLDPYVKLFLIEEIEI